MIFDLVKDFADVLDAMPEGHPRWRMLKLLDEAIRRDVHFIDRHPTTFFQCMWNTCWWYDCPEARDYYCENPPDDTNPAPWEITEPRTTLVSNWSQRVLRFLRRTQTSPTTSAVRLSTLVEEWRDRKEARQPRFPWIRSCRPPARHLGCSAIQSRFTGHEHASSPQARLNALTLGAFFSQSSLAVTLAADDHIRTWDTLTGEQFASMRVPGAHPAALAVSPDDRLVATLSIRDPYSHCSVLLTLHDARTLNVLQSMPLWKSKRVDGTKIVWSPDQAHVAISDAGTTRIVSLQQRNVVNVVQAHDAVFDPTDGRLLFLRNSSISRKRGGESPELTVEIGAVVPGEESDPEVIKCTPTFAPGPSLDAIQVLARTELIRNYHKKTATIRKAQEHARARQDVFFDSVSPRPRATPDLLATEDKNKHLVSVERSADGSRLAAVYGDESLTIVDLAGMRHVAIYREFAELDRCTLDARGKRALLGGGGRSQQWFEVIDVEQEQPHYPLREQDFHITALVAPFHGKEIYGVGRRVCVWDGKTGKLLRHWDGPQGGCHVMACLPGNSLLAVGDISGSLISVWNVDTEKEINIPVDRSIFQQRSSAKTTIVLPGQAGAVVAHSDNRMRDTEFSLQKAGHKTSLGWFSGALSRLQQRTPTSWIGLRDRQLVILEIEGAVGSNHDVT